MANNTAKVFIFFFKSDEKICWIKNILLDRHLVAFINNVRKDPNKKGRPEKLSSKKKYSKKKTLFSNSQRGSTESFLPFFCGSRLSSKGLSPLAYSGFSDSPFPSRRPALLVFVPVVSGTRCRVVAC